MSGSPTVHTIHHPHRYGQMTAGSYCYIGPQGIVHGTTVCYAFISVCVYRDRHVPLLEYMYMLQSFQYIVFVTVFRLILLASIHHTVVLPPS